MSGGSEISLPVIRDELDRLELEADESDKPLILNASPEPAVREPRISTRQAVAKYGTDKASANIVSQEKTKAQLANREIIRRLMRDPGEFKSSELNFIAGTAVDKVAKKERWDRSGDDGGKGWLEQFVGMVSKLQADTSLKLSLEVVSPSGARAEGTPMPEVIDVTPND